MRPERKALITAVPALFCVALPLALAAAPLACSDDPMPQQEIQARCNKAAQMISKKNLEGFSGLIAPRAEFLLNGRKSSFEEWKQNLKKDLASKQNLHTTLHVEKCLVKGNSGVAFLVETDDFTVPTVKGHQFHAVKRITLTLVKSDKGWVSTRVAFESHTLTRDGMRIARK